MPVGGDRMMTQLPFAGKREATWHLRECARLLRFVKATLAADEKHAVARAWGNLDLAAWRWDQREKCIRAEGETMSDKPTIKKTRGPRQPKKLGPLELADFVHKATAGWDVSDHALFTRVLEALRGPS